MYVLFFSGRGLELKRLAAARPPQVSTTDVVPCDCVLLRGAWVANEATISGESVSQMKDAVPREARALDLENDCCHCLFSGSRVVRASDGDSIPADPEIPATPDGGCFSSQGELLQDIEFSRESVTGDSKEIMVALAILTCFCVGGRWVCVAARPPRRRENAARADHQVHHHLHECGGSRFAHADVTYGEVSAHLSPLCRCVLH